MRAQGTCFILVSPLLLVPAPISLCISAELSWGLSLLLKPLWLDPPASRCSPCWILGFSLGPAPAVHTLPLPLSCLTPTCQLLQKGAQRPLETALELEGTERRARLRPHYRTGKLRFWGAVGFPVSPQASASWLSQSLAGPRVGLGRSTSGLAPLSELSVLGPHSL